MSHRHRTMPMMSPFPVDIDIGIAGIVERCWARGLRTMFSCQGDPARASGPPGGSATETLAYVSFATREDVDAFVRAARLPLAHDEVHIFSRFSETCTACGHLLDVGATTIWRPKTKGLRHVRCAPLVWRESRGAVRFAHEHIATIERNVDEFFVLDS